MRKHGGTPSQRDKQVTLAAISPPGVPQGRFVWGRQSGLAGCKPPPLFKCRASSCSSQRQRQREPWGASPQPSAPTYLPTCISARKRFVLISLYHVSHPSLHGLQSVRLTSDVFYSPFGMRFIHFVQKGHSFIAFHFANRTFHTYCITSLLQGLAHNSQHAIWSVFDLPYVVL